MSSGAIGSNFVPLSPQEMLDRANQGNPSLPTGGPRSTGEVRQSNSVIGTGNAKLEEQLKLLTDTLMSMITAFGQMVAGAPNPRAGYGATPPAAPPSEQQRADYDTKKAAFDASQSYDKTVGAKEAELKALSALATLFPSLPPPWTLTLDDDRLAAIANDPGNTIEQREAAKFFVGHSDERRSLQLAAKESNGGSRAEITAQDLGIRHAQLFSELMQLKANPVAKAQDPGPAPTGASSGAGSAPTTTGTPSTGNAPANDSAGGTTGATPRDSATINGTPLERAAQRTGQMRASIEEEIDALAKQMGDLDPKSPTFKKDSDELDRKIKSLASTESMLMNMENMLRQTIDNIIKMRQEMAMNAIRHIS